MNVEVAVLGSPSLIVLIKQHRKDELGCGLCGRVKQHRTVELGSCVNVDVAVLGSPSLIIRTVSVDVEQHLKEKKNEKADQKVQKTNASAGRTVS